MNLALWLNRAGLSHGSLRHVGTVDAPRLPVLRPVKRLPLTGVAGKYAPTVPQWAVMGYRPEGIRGTTP